MSQIRSGSEATAAALVGSLASFSLFEVLEMLARTGHTGELQVVGRAIDQRVWIDHGDLLDTNGGGSNSGALFELACVEEGWFYFTLLGSVPEGGTRTPVSSVLKELGPRVQEWRALVAALPFDARVSMSSSTPGPAVQIRSDQWQILSLVGNPGRTVRSIVDAAESHPLDTLRTLRELIEARLLSLVLTSPSFSTPYPHPGEPDTSSAPHERLEGSSPARGAHAATPATAAGDDSSKPKDPQPVPIDATNRGDSQPASIPPAPAGFVERDESVEGPLPSQGQKPDDTAVHPRQEGPAKRRDGTGATGADMDRTSEGLGAGSTMPPPISGDPWSGSVPADRGSA